MRHELKTWPEYFEAVLDGRKTFEIRKNDRKFAVGDILILQEYLPITKVYTIRSIEMQVTYMVVLGSQFGLDASYVCMGIV